MKLFGKKEIVDRFDFMVGEGGVADEGCFFCGATVIFPTDESTIGDAGVLAVQQIPSGERIHVVCHVSCAQRARH